MKSRQINLGVLSLGTNSEIAAKRYSASLNGVAKLIFHYYDSIPEIFESLESQNTELATIPVFNSICGETRYKLRAESGCFSKVGKVKIQIAHCLGISRYSLGEDFVLSHPEALKQCSDYLDKNYPKATRWECSSTAEAARIVSERNRGLAIAGLEVLVRHGLKVVDKNIVKNNWSEFWVLALKNNQNI